MKKFLLTILSILAVALTGYGAVVQVSVDPAPGEVTQVPQTIKVSTDVDVYFFSLGMNKGKITFTDAAGNSYEPTHSLATNSLGKAKEFEVTLNQAYTEPGTYKLWIKGTSLIADDYGEYANAEQTFTWTIAEGGSTEPETPELDPNAVNFIGTTPEQGVVSELPAVIYLHADQDLYFSNYKFADKVKLTDANGTSYAISGITSDDGDKIYDNFKITLTDGAITTPGTYTLWMAATTLRDNATMSKGNKETTFTWTVEGSSEPEKPTAVNILNVTPAEGTVEELSSILVEVDQPIVMHPMADFSLVDEAGTYYLPTRELVDPNGDGVIKHAKFTFETPITAAGTYTFSMSANALANMEMQIGTPATSYTYTIVEKAEEPSIAITSIEPAEGIVTEIPATIKIVTDSKNLNDITANRVQKWMSLTDDKGNTYAMTGKTTNSYTSVTLTLTNGAITAPGTYTLTLKDEAITEYGNAAMHTNPATFTWTIEDAEPEYMKILGTDPAEGVVEKLPSVIFITTDTDLVDASYSKMSLKDANGTEYAIKESGPHDRQGDGFFESAYLMIANEITAPGTYTLTVEEGAIIEYNGPKVNEALSFTWTIEEAAPAEPVVTISPAEGETVDALSKVIVTCDQGIAVNGLKYSSVKGMTSTTLFSLYNQVDVNTVELILESEITDGGEYTIEIQPGVFTLNPTGAATTYPEAVWATKVNVSGALATKLEVTPADQSTLETVQHFTVTFAKGIMVKPGYTTEEQPFLGYTDPTTGASEQIELTVGATTETSVTLSTAAEQTKAGYYTLVIPAGFFVLENMYLNEYIMCQYNVTGKEVPGPGSDYIQILRVDPAEGTVTEIPATISLYTDTDLGSTLFSEMSLTDANGNEYGFHSSGNNDSDDNGSYDRAWVKLADMQPITAPGTYTLTVKPGALGEYNNLSKTNEEVSFTWTIEGGQDPQPSTDYVFNADEYEAGSEYTTLEDGIYTFLQGEGSTKTWIVEENSKDFSNFYGFTKRIKPQTDKNYITADVPAAGKLVFGVISSSSSDNSRTLSVVQNGTELYGQVVCDANDKVDGVYNVHEVAVEEGLATITMSGALNFYFIEFVESSEPAGDFFDLVSVPEAGEVPLLPSKLYVYAGEEIVNADPYNLSKITLTDANGNNYVQSAGAVDYDGDAKYDGLYIRIASGNTNITTAGTYTLTIAESLITLKESGKVNKEATFTWTVTGETPVIEFIKVDPAEGVVEEIPTTITVYTDTDLDMPDISLMSLTDEKGNSYDIVSSYWGTDVFGTGFIYLAEAITAPGTYTLTLQAGALQEYYGTKVNEEKSFTWTIEGGETPELDPDHINFLSVDPAEGKVTELPAEIWVTTDTDLYIGTSNSAQNKFHLTDANGNTYAVTAVAKDNDGNYSYESVRIKLTNGAITAPGTYTLTFDEGALKKDSDKTFINLAKSFTWTIEDTSAELIQVLSVDPAEGVVEVLPRTIDIFTDTDLVAATVSQMTMKDASGNEYAVMEATPGDSDQNGSYDRLRISLAQEITTPGTYTLTIPAGTIQEMGGTRTNAELTFTWTVATVEYIEVYSIDPEEGNLGQLPALISIYTNADIISVAESKVSLVDDKGNNHALKITTKDTDYDETAETVEFELVNGAIKTQGTYTLTIEKGAMVDYSDPNLTNNTLVFVWEVEGTGIAGIEAGADGYVVYDLNGYLVMQTRDAADLRRLERGFYIINGKKVVLNK